MQKENIYQYVAVALSLVVVIAFSHTWVLSY